MNQKTYTPCLSIFLLFLVLLFTCACATSSSVKTKPTKASLSAKERQKLLQDKEIVIIDKQEYIKVLNPKASEEKDQLKYMYVPVDEYLSKRDLFITPVLKTEEIKNEASLEPMTLPEPATAPSKGAVPKAASSKPALPECKKKVLIAHFDDQTASGEENLGDEVAEKLAADMAQRSQQVLPVDFKTVIDFLNKKGISLKEIETPKVLLLLNEAFGIQLVVTGELTGPYVFTTRTAYDKEETASAVIKLDVRMIDVLTAKAVKTLSASNPISATATTGPSSKENAKSKAVALAVKEAGRSLMREIDRVDWFCRIVRIEGKDVYLNAGQSTGIKIGDILDMFQTDQFGTYGASKGKIQISGFSGTDGSIGNLIQGEEPRISNLLKLSKSQGT